jgi:hypothetical protein
MREIRRSERERERDRDREREGEAEIEREVDTAVADDLCAISHLHLQQLLAQVLG